jgi:GntR family transcriptional regulator
MLYLTIDTQSPVPVYLQIMEQIRARASEGALTPGVPLPPVRQLAADLGINPNTVAKAYMLLEREGILLTIKRRGTFLAPTAPARAQESMDARIESTVERILDETAALGVDRSKLLSVLRRKLLGDPQDNQPSGGENS